MTTAVCRLLMMTRDGNPGHTVAWDWDWEQEQELDPGLVRISCLHIPMLCGWRANLNIAIH